MMTVASSTYAQAAPAANAVQPGLYIVQFDGDPLASYAGGINGIAATKPTGGQKLNPKAWNYDAYRKHLQSQRANTLKKANLAGKKPVLEYDTVLNGAAYNLTAPEAQKLRGTAGVVNLWKQQMYRLQTADTPRFLGLDGANGVWQQKFGGDAHAGEGVIVGVIDSGITPESASFAALPEPRPDADTIASKWYGTCDPGVEAPQVTCNNKLIGARYYPVNGVADKDYLSPRDWDGHGTHTASTAAGNHGVAATVNGEAQGNISGMAPAARVAAYKVCWEQGGGSGCGGAQILAAINDAVADGVDVINYSIGSSGQNEVLDAAEIAFMHAASAGVFVAASAGNDGAGTDGLGATADHNSPWLATVAASTHDRTFAKSVTLGNGTTYNSLGYGPALPSKPLIDAANAGLPGVPATTSKYCFSADAPEGPGVAVLDPAKVAGKIVICERGVNGRTDKAVAVKNAGGVGMIMWNPTANSINADFMIVPTVHVDTAVGQAIKAYAATANATASMTASQRKVAQAPVVATFSSRGPAEKVSGDLLKPDITAPGVDVIAAVAPPGHNGNKFDAISGTSMSSPHIAGIAALMKGYFPGWSPAAIKSALMTTASQTDNTGGPIRQEAGAGTAPSNPLAYGAGHVNPKGAYDAGLIYDAGPVDWLKWICGTGNDLAELPDSGFSCADLEAVVGKADPSDLNYPSISIGDLTGKQTVTRTVTNTTNLASVYVPKVEVPAGYTVKVSPSVLTVLPRRSATYTVEVTRTNAAFGQFSFGSLTWSDLRGHSVRSPIALRSTPVSAPASIDLTGTSGSQQFQVRPGFTGTLATKVNGLAASTVTTKNLVGTNPNFNTAAPVEGPAVFKKTVTIPANAMAARVGTLDVQYPAGTDLDLYVYYQGQLAAVSGGTTAEESVDLPAGITVDVYVVQYGLAGGRTQQDVHLHTWAVAPGPVGNLTLTPSAPAVTSTVPVTLTANWSGLNPNSVYLGVLQFGQGSSLPVSTFVQVRT